jgi:hypothetical protein
MPEEPESRTMVWLALNKDFDVLKGILFVGDANEAE